MIPDSRFSLIPIAAVVFCAPAHAYARWRAQFTGRQHGDPVKIGRDVQNISGATLSCEHVTDGIRRLLATYAIAIAGR